MLGHTNFTRYAVLPTLEPAHRLHMPAMAKQLHYVVTTAFFDELDAAAN